MSHIPTDSIRTQVRAMAAYGLDPQAIASIISISLAELGEHYQHELALGPHEAEAKIRQALYAKAIGGDVMAMKLWLEQNAGAY